MSLTPFWHPSSCSRAPTPHSTKPSAWDEFGMDGGKTHGFRMDVTSRIQAEAIKTE